MALWGRLIGLVRLELGQFRRVKLQVLDRLLANANLMLTQQIKQFLAIDQRDRRRAALEGGLLGASGINIPTVRAAPAADSAHRGILATGA